MKRRTLKSLIGGIALSMFAIASAGISTSAYAQMGPPGDPCPTGGYSNTSVGLSINGNCTINGNVTGTTGSVSISMNNGNLTINGTVNAANGQIYLSGNALKATKTITAAAGQIYLYGQSVNAAAVSASDFIDARASAGNLSFSGLVQSTNSYVYLIGQNITSTKAISAGAYIQATDSNIQTINITGTVTSGTANSGQGGSVYLWAQGNVATGSITDKALNAAVKQQGYIDIKANLGGANVPFIIGGAGKVNGVNGKLVTDTTMGGGIDDQYSHGGVYITNGAAGSTGGITVTSVSNISVKASSSKAGLIALDAKAGILTLPSGTLSADGAAGFQAGSIILFAKTVNAANDSVLSASQNSAAAGSAHGIIVAAGTVNYGGSTKGLGIHADGNGASSSLTASVALTPYNSAYIYEPGPNNPTVCLCVYFNNGNPNSYVGPVSYNAVNGSILNVTANGNNSSVTFSGYPMSITGGDVTFQSQGATNHQVYVGFYSGGTGSASLTFGNNGTTLLDASAGNSAGTGGSVTVNAYTATITAPTTFTMNANGPTSGVGDGGTIGFYANGSSTFGSSLKGILTANASSANTGNGNASAITFYPGTTNLTLGTGAGQFAVTSKGGMLGGNGGNVIVQPNGNLTSSSTAAVDVSAIGGNGNGGNATLTTFAQTAINGLVHCDGFGSGTGGVCNITGNTVDLTGGIITANGGMKGNGNTVNVTSSGGSADILVSSGTSIFAQGGGAAGSSNNGGSITLTSGRAISISSGGDVNASAVGPQGKGGVVTLKASQSSNSNISVTGIISADGGTTGGAGGQISLQYKEPAGASNLTLNPNAAITADSRDSTPGGSITFVNSNNAGLTVNSANAKISAKGGTVTFSDASQGVIVNAANTTVAYNPITGSVVASGTSVNMTVNGVSPYNSANRLELKSVKASSTDVKISTLNIVLAVVGQHSSNPAVSAGLGMTTLIGDKIEIALDSAPGDDYVFGKNATVETNLQSDQDIVVGSNISATQAAIVTVNNTGSIVPLGGKVQGQTITLKADKRNIGTSSTAPLLLEARSTIQASTTPTTPGNIYLSNNSPTVEILSPPNQNTGGEYFVSSTGDVTLDSVVSQGGTIQITTVSAKTLTVQVGATIQTNLGDVRLGVGTGGTIKVLSDSTLSAKCICQAFGDVYLSLIGFPTEDVVGITPANVTPTVNGAGHIYFNAGISATSPNNSVTATNRTVGFDVFTSPPASIFLGGGVTISAQN